MKGLFKSKIAIGSVIVVIIAIGGYAIFHRKTTQQFITVKRGPITQTVSVTGNTTPANSVSLTFGASGIISNTYSDIGKKVYAGQVLAELDTSDLTAQLHQAQANVDVEQAKLQGLQNGSRPEDIASSQAALDKADQDLANMYASINDTSIDSYAKATDAVRNQLSAFFNNAEGTNPTITYTTAYSQSQSNAQQERFSATALFSKWQIELASVPTSDNGLETLLQDEVSYLGSVRQLLNDVSDTLKNAPSLSATTLATYQASVTAALTEINIASKNLNTISQNIASQKLTISQLQAQLSLKQAGSLPTDISAQQAQVAQVQASVDAVNAQIRNSEIIAPINGTVTQFDAKVGQVASVATPLISIMSNTGYEVDAGVSETDVGKVNVGDHVMMTLDAFSGETFTGSVFYIAPSETNTQGVISYLTKISFAKPDSRLKSGLTANIDIDTQHKDNVLLLPEYAILQNDLGSFVETVEGKTTKQDPVTLGIQDQNGNVEITSGVTEGEQVLNIGLKQ